MAEITGVLLAAGFSRRFGSNKLLARLDGRALIEHSAAALAPCDRLIAVVRSDDLALQSLLPDIGVEAVINTQPQRGMGYSIACAVAASADSDGCCLLPADMPWVKSSTIRQLVAALRGGAPLAAPFYQGRRGHPVAFSAPFFTELAALDGDSGARHILQQHRHQLTVITSDDPGVLRDVDTSQAMGAPPVVGA